MEDGERMTDPVMWHCCVDGWRKGYGLDCPERDDHTIHLAQTDAARKKARRHWKMLGR